MLKKIFKTIFILCICVSITLPVNAGSVNVSDSSAFITKSEMAYQLNNLSNRMYQLENSLDSKIDTLVSSYLTRNGIWNGQDQTYLVAKNTYYTSTGVLSQTFVKPNKTGLLFTYIISNYKHALQCFADTKPDYESIVNGNANINVRIYGSNSSEPVWSNTKVVTWAGQWDTQQDNVSGTGIDYNCADTKDIDYVDTCMFFVDKDNEYRLETTLDQITQIHWNDASDVRTGLDWSTSLTGSRIKWNGPFNEGRDKYWGKGSYYKYQIGIGDILTVY